MRLKLEEAGKSKQLWPRDLTDRSRFSQKLLCALLFLGTCGYRITSHGFLFSQLLEIQVGGQRSMRGQCGASPHLYPDSHMHTNTRTHTLHSTGPLTPSQGLQNTLLLKDAAEISWHTARALNMTVGRKGRPHTGDPVCHLNVNQHCIPLQPSRMQMAARWGGCLARNLAGASCSGKAGSLQVLWQHTALLTGLLQPPLSSSRLLLAQVLAPLVLPLLHLLHHVL